MFFSYSVERHSVFKLEKDTVCCMSFYANASQYILNLKCAHNIASSVQYVI